MKESRPLSVACFIAGLSVLAITATMNFLFGETMGATYQGRLTYSFAAIICDIAGLVVFGMIVGRLLKHRAYLAAILPATVLVLAVGWSIMSMMGFGATERLSAAAGRREAIARDARADALVERHIRWLRDASVRRRQSKADRREFLSAASTELHKMKDQPVETRILADGQAELLAKLSTMSVENTQIGLIAYISILLILLKATAFSYASYFWPAKGTRLPSATTASEPDETEEPEDRGRPKLRVITNSSIRPAGPPFAKQEAREDIEERIAQGGQIPTQDFLAKRWNRPKSTVSRWLTQFERERVCSRNRVGQCNEIMGAQLPAAA